VSDEEQMSNRIAALEAGLRQASFRLADMHEGDESCGFHDSQPRGDDIGCLACIAQMEISEVLNAPYQPMWDDVAAALGGAA
jgi:hypothetical protein